MAILELRDRVLERNPDGKTLEHFFLDEVTAVPLVYGDPVEKVAAPVVAGIGTTVAVLRTTTTDSLVAAPAAVLAPVARPVDSTAQAHVFVLEPAPAVCVTVMVTAAAVTVTVAPISQLDEAGTTVTYWVDVGTPVMVSVPVS